MATNETQTGETETEQQIPDDVLTALRRNGESDLFMQVIQTPASEVGVARNSARQEILKYVDWAEESDKDVTDYMNYGGGFFQNLRNGSPAGADMNNQQIVDYVRNGGGETINTTPL